MSCVFTADELGKRGSRRGERTAARLLLLPVACLIAVFLSAAEAGDAAPGTSTPPVSWRVPKREDVQAQAFALLDERKADDRARSKAKQLWEEGSAGAAPGDLLDRVARTIALVDENARKLVGLCSQPRSEPMLPGQAWLADSRTPSFLAGNLRLYYGRWLVQERLYDEAREQLAELKPEEVVDPAALLFYQAVVYHRLLEREPGLTAIARLLGGLEEQQEVPQRYLAVARLMKHDLEALKPDTLDHIARRMEDIERRLDLGRAGKKVREVQDSVIASLDKLIKQAEKRQQQQQQQAGSSGRHSQPGNPAQESRIMETKGPGQVAGKDIGSQSGWGDLPPKQREEALQQIGREFPPHYRDAVEQYFRKLAGQGSQPPPPP